MFIITPIIINLAKSIMQSHTTSTKCVTICTHIIEIMIKRDITFNQC